jgi:predicted AlkP superfamily phosphohydrolase/phosphomutase
MTRVLAILLDAASPDLIEKWTDDGSLPNLKRLRKEGAYGRLDSVAEWLSEATHYVYHTGANPGATALAGYSIWDKETMQNRLPAADWRPFTPFWRTFREGGPRAVVVDPASVYAPEAFNGVEIIGWASHDALAPFQTYPPELAAGIERRFGSWLLPDESYGPMTKREFMSTVNLMQEINEKFKNLCIELMHTQEWDLFLAHNFTAHNAGHRLWSTVNVTDRLSESEKAELDGSLRRVYMDCDATIGAIVAAAGPETRVLVFSLHGMGANHSRTFAFPEMLRRIVDGRPSSPGLLKRLRALVPQDWRHKAKSLLPFEMRRRLTSYWRMSEYKWETTRAFSLLSDTEAWVRINLKGREARGIVEPGEEYEALLRKIAEGLKTFVDADTGAPLVQDVVLARDIFTGGRVEDLPDLIVLWSDTPASQHRAINSPQFGMIAWPTPGHNPEGRSGNHRPQGMLIAAGPGVKSGAIRNADILDLAPTILALLGQPIPAAMDGKPVDLVR